MLIKNTNMKRQLVIALALLCAFAGMAKERTTAELQQIAAAQLKKSNARTAKAVGKSGNLSLSCTLQQDGVAVYAAKGYGSVVLTTDDRFTPVIGYTDAVITDVSTLPCGMQWWLYEMQQQMQSDTVVKKVAYKTIQVAGQSYDAVEPLVTTRWGQTSPYNGCCPLISGQHAPAGCCAVAMAQIFNYNKYPQGASFTGSYTTVSDSTKTACTEDINSTYSYPYQTAYGLYSPTGTSSFETMAYSADDSIAVGTLLRDCGYSINMSYSRRSSGANALDVVAAAVNCFSYPRESVKHYYREYYADDEWHNIVYGEIAAGYPVIYAGVDAKSGGHAFIVNGIDSEGLVYVNWGWLGWCDGYYAMDLMNPRKYQLTNEQALVTGWHPTALPSDHFTSQWIGEDLTLSTDDTQKAINISGGFYNMAAFIFKGTVTMVFEDQANKTTEALALSEEADGDYNWGNGFYFPTSDLSEDLNFLQKGHTYKVYFTSQQQGEQSAQMLRTVSGCFYYMLSLDNEGNVTIGDQQIGTTSGIERIAAEQPTDDTIYNIGGQKVGKNHRGLAIKNGKKMVVR